MNKAIWLILTLVCLIACGTNQSEQSLSEIESNDLIVVVTPHTDTHFTAQFREKAADFRELRPVEGQFSGGEWVEEVDAWNGRKHQLMLDIANELEGNRYVESDITSHLGQPDQIVQQGESLYATLRPDTSPTEKETTLLIYHWRDNHDFLFFVSEEQIITEVDWWYSGE
ncbi:MAG: hypothetical protein AAF490_23060 [Chloroflexota bacterium]